MRISSLILFAGLVLFCHRNMKVEKKTSLNSDEQAKVKISNDIQELGKYLDLKKYLPDSVLYKIDSNDERYELEAVLYLDSMTLERMYDVEKAIEWVNYEVTAAEFEFDWLQSTILSQVKAIDNGRDGHAEFYFKALPHAESLWINEMMFIKMKNK